MNETVAKFYDKDSYQESYDSQHGARLDALVARYKLKEHFAGKRVVDIGGGLGFLGKRLDSTTDYWVMDGAVKEESQRVSKGTWHYTDLDRDAFGELAVLRNRNGAEDDNHFDAAFCLETLEHLSNPYHCLIEIKKLVKVGGEIYLSVPPISVTHNVVYPGLLWPVQNFSQFLGQMALEIVDFWEYTPADRGWPATHWMCRNLGWENKRMLFPKVEEKFRLATPLEMTNL